MKIHLNMNLDQLDVRMGNYILDGEVERMRDLLVHRHNGEDTEDIDDVEWDQMLAECAIREPKPTARQQQQQPRRLAANPALLGAQLLAMHDGLAQPAMHNTEQALYWLRQVAPLCQADGEQRDTAADELGAMRATVAELQAELAQAKQVIFEMSQATPVSVTVHSDTHQLQALGAKTERQRVRCSLCEKIVATRSPQIEHNGNTWHANCWDALRPTMQTMPAEQEPAPTFDDRPDWTAPEQAPEVQPEPQPTPEPTPEPVPVTQELPGYFDQPDPPKVPAEPADEWPQFAHLRPMMRDWAIKKELAKRGVAQ